MRRGDIYWVDLDPAQGAEANKIRPAVVVSNDAANRAAGRGGRGGAANVDREGERAGRKWRCGSLHVEDRAVEARPR